MCVITAQEHMRKHVEAREGLVKIFNRLMEKILVANAHKDTYWILGKSKCIRKRGVDIIRPFLEACDEKPGLVKDSFVYEVDNRRGVKTLLWIMHPGGTLSFPTLGKSISVAGDNSGGLILPPK